MQAILSQQSNVIFKGKKWFNKINYWVFLYKYEVQFTVIEELLIFKALFWAEDDLQDL